MVTKPSAPVPPHAEGLKKMPKIDPPQLATRAPYSPAYKADSASPSKDLANKDRTGDNSFKLPERVTQAEVRDGSFKYGGGRSSGNRPLEVNKQLKEIEP